MKNSEIEAVKKSIMSDKYKDMDEFINNLFKYIDNIPESNNSELASDHKEDSPMDVGFPSQFKKRLSHEPKNSKITDKPDEHNSKLGILK